MTINCVCSVGDSNTFALISYALDYADRVVGFSLSDPRTMGRWYKTSTNCIGANYAVSGYRISDLVSQAPLLDALLPANKGGRVSPAGRKYILSILIGTNCEGGGTSAQIAAASVLALAAYLDARKAAGWDAIILGTIMSRGDGIIADFETYRQAYNAAISDPTWMAAHGVDAIFPFGASDNLIGAVPGPGTGYNDTTVFNADKVHLIQAGQDVGYGLWGPVLESVLA